MILFMENYTSVFQEHWWWSVDSSVWSLQCSAVHMHVCFFIFSLDCKRKRYKRSGLFKLGENV